MIKVEHAVAIPKPGRKSPESEHSSVTTKSNESDQHSNDQQLMRLETALVRALQQLATKPED
jgi:hypothetical protein